jgi:hypothetical protein
MMLVIQTGSRLRNWETHQFHSNGLLASHSIRLREHDAGPPEIRWFACLRHWKNARQGIVERDWRDGRDEAGIQAWRGSVDRRSGSERM